MGQNRESMHRPGLPLSKVDLNNDAAESLSILPEATLREQHETKRAIFWSNWLNCTHTLQGAVTYLNWNLHLCQVCAWIFSLQGLSQRHYTKLTNGFTYI